MPLERVANGFEKQLGAEFRGIPDEPGDCELLDMSGLLNYRHSPLAIPLGDRPSALRAMAEAQAYMQRRGVKKVLMPLKMLRNAIEDRTANVITQRRAMAIRRAVAEKARG